MTGWVFWNGCRSGHKHNPAPCWRREKGPTRLWQILPLNCASDLDKTVSRLRRRHSRFMTGIVRWECSSSVTKYCGNLNASPSISSWFRLNRKSKKQAFVEILLKWNLFRRSSNPSRFITSRTHSSSSPSSSSSPVNNTRNLNSFLQKANRFNPHDDQQ